MLILLICEQERSERWSQNSMCQEAFHVASLLTHVLGTINKVSGNKAKSAHPPDLSLPFPHPFPQFYSLFKTYINNNIHLNIPSYIFQVILSHITRRKPVPKCVDPLLPVTRSATSSS